MPMFDQCGHFLGRCRVFAIPSLELQILIEFWYAKTQKANTLAMVGDRIEVKNGRLQLRLLYSPTLVLNEL
jgi:hypothetical protein